jgi:hypothetical protein
LFWTRTVKPVQWAEVRRVANGDAIVSLLRRETTLFVPMSLGKIVLRRNRWRIERHGDDGPEVVADVRSEAAAWSAYRAVSGDER